jgi:hypothetical protein
VLVIFKGSTFTHDGKTRLLTLGTPGVPGVDDTHFSQPTFMAFMDANSWYARRRP